MGIILDALLGENRLSIRSFAVEPTIARLGEKISFSLQLLPREDVYIDLVVVKLTCTEVSIDDRGDDRDTYRHVAYEAKREYGRLVGRKEIPLILEGDFLVPRDMVGSFRSKHNFIDWSANVEVFIPNNKIIHRETEIVVLPKLVPFTKEENK